MGAVRSMADKENLGSDSRQVSFKNIQLEKKPQKFAHLGIRQTGLDDRFWYLLAP